MKKAFFFTAAHSGGHIIPALTLARRLCMTGSAAHFQTIGLFSTDAPSDVRLIESFSGAKSHIRLPWITCRSPKLVVGLLYGVYHSLLVLYRERPACVVSTGGLIAVPVCCAAWLLRIPFELYELNVRPGRAVALLSRFARTVFICFPETVLYVKGNVVLTEYPIRYTEYDRISRQDARLRLEIADDRSTLLIIGGSQGSRFINNLVKKFVEQLSNGQRKRLHMVHQAGVCDVVEMQGFYASYGMAARVFAYDDNIAWAYQAADYVVTRAGAGVLHELLFFKQRALIIPLEAKSTSHQIDNARAFVQKEPGLMSMLLQADLMKDPQQFYAVLMLNLPIM